MVRGAQHQNSVNAPAQIVTAMRPTCVPSSELACISGNDDQALRRLWAIHCRRDGRPQPVLFAVTDFAAHAALLTADFPAALARFLRTHKRKIAFPDELN